MEDAHIAKFNIIPDVHIFGVFDGHGGTNYFSDHISPSIYRFLAFLTRFEYFLNIFYLGKEVALYVERHFVDELLANEEFKKGAYDKALTETFLKMDILLNTAEGKKELSTLKSGEDSKGGLQADSFAGCTANVALIAKGELIVANAGDSRTIISCKGTSIEMSDDHKPDLPKERERVQKAGGYVSDGRINGNLNLSRALGDLEYKRNTDLQPGEQLISAVPEIKTRTLTPDDEFLVIGCDGIWETMSNQSIVEFFGQRISPTTELSKVVEEFLDKNLAQDTSSKLTSYLSSI